MSRGEDARQLHGGYNYRYRTPNGSLQAMARRLISTRWPPYICGTRVVEKRFPIPLKPIIVRVSVPSWNDTIVTLEHSWQPSANAGAYWFGEVSQTAHVPDGGLCVALPDRRRAATSPRFHIGQPSPAGNRGSNHFVVGNQYGFSAEYGGQITPTIL